MKKETELILIFALAAAAPFLFFIIIRDKFLINKNNCPPCPDADNNRGAAKRDIISRIFLG